MSQKLIRTCAHAFGLLALARAMRRRGVRILMYHRFPEDTRGLARECEHIRRHYRPVPLREIAESFRDGKPLPSNAVAITIDDGYRDYLRSGEPVFYAHDIPTTVFLVSDFIDGKLWLWTDIIEYAVAQTRRSCVTFQLGGEPAREWTFPTAQSKRAAGRAIIDQLKELDHHDRVQAMSRLFDALDVEIPTRPPDECAPLTWSEVRTLARRATEFGAHTRTHPILSRLNDPAAVQDEIVGSKTHIESELGRPVIHFCYPNGRNRDFTDETVGVLERAGFQTAVCTERGLNFAGASRFRLRRLGVEPANPMPYFSELLAGIRAQ